MTLLTGLVAIASALAVDWLGERAGLLPPGFRPEAGGLWRRAFATALLAFVLWLGVFAPLAAAGAPMPPPAERSPLAVFALHGCFGTFLAVWWVLGYLGGGAAGTAAADPLRLRARRPAAELGIGALAGVAAWLGVLAVLLAIGFVLQAVGEGELLPREPPALIPWLAGLPVALRLAVSASAGLFEELFFRAFLQPRIGVALSSAFFILAHATYDQPLMLVGITLLSLVFSWLTWWRRTVWAAVAAHALFDAVQLLVVVPLALEVLERGAP